MKKGLKRALWALVILTLAITTQYVYQRHWCHNFREIDPGKAYNSGVIPPDELPEYIRKYGIKTVIDLRFPGTGDLENNPEVPEELMAEKAAVEKIPGVRYVNNGSDQVPTEANLSKFFEVLDDPRSYPVLFHCYHGIGRAQLYAAIYKIEYMGYTNEQARRDIVYPLWLSSFDDGTPKGEYLKHYHKRHP